MKDSHKKPFKIVVFGGAGVGKSALTIRYVFQEFSKAYDPTIEENYHTSIELDGSPVKVEVIDTAGNDVFRRMREQYIETGDGFLLVYSVIDPCSTTSLTNIQEQILSVKGQKDKIIPEIPLVLVGNKCDLEDERKISYEDGKKIAAEFSCPFSETSAKNDIGVDEVFSNLARQIKEFREQSKRKYFLRDRRRFFSRNMSLRERKRKKEKLHALRTVETPSTAPMRRRSHSFRGFVCGAGSLGAT